MICSYFYSVYEKEVDYLFMIVFILFGLIYVCLFFYGLFVIYLKGVIFLQCKNLYDNRSYEEFVLWIVIKLKVYFKCILDLYYIKMLN